MNRLEQTWFARPAAEVAKDLIGTALVHGERAGIIVETEAYIGPHDKACHARFGPTARTAVMFGPAGRSYVYLCYGIHEMFNIVTGADGDGQAVLIRAVAHPDDDDGSDPAWGRGPGQAVLIRAIAPLTGLGDDLKIGRGPGKVTRALGLDRSHNRRELAIGDLYVASHTTPPKIAIGPRIGVDYAGSWARRKLRFWWHDHPSVTKA